MNDRAYKNGGVWDDEDPGPAGPDATPPCPICPADRPHRVVPNSGKAGGYLCEGCGFLLSPEAGGDNHKRRDMWEHETKKRSA